MAERKFNSRELTDHLRRLAAGQEGHVVDGELVTRGEALAHLLWKKALGYKETVKDDYGREQIVEHRPEAWAIQLVYDRMEGRTPQAEVADDGKVNVAERVRDMAKSRLNEFAAAAARTTLPPVPTFKPKQDTDG